MTALANAAVLTALEYAERGWPVFPCSSRKVPMVQDWGNAATTDPAIITTWWTDAPHALIGMPTGERTGLAGLDIDMKGGHNGLRALGELDCPILPATPTVLTRTGGLHLHFERPEGGFRNTVGEHGRGIGDGLDWRCDGGYVILPSPGSGYRWGEWNYGNCTRLPVPEALLPREVEPNPFTAYSRSTSPSVGQLAGVLRCLHAAAPGERNSLLFWAGCRFAEAIDAGVIGEQGAHTLLHQGGAAIGLRDREIAATIRSAFGRRT